EIVRDARGDFADGLQAVAAEQDVLRHAQLRFGAGLLGDVVDEHRDEGLLAIEPFGPYLEDLIAAATGVPPYARECLRSEDPAGLVERQLAQAGMQGRGFLARPGA